jgi:carbon monoxide dehydrogenase subunit G
LQERTFNLLRHIVVSESRDLEVENKFCVKLNYIAMKKQMRFLYISLLLISIFCFAGCDDDDYNDDDTPTPNNIRIYTLNQLDSSGVSGTVTFSKVDDKTTNIVIQLTGTQSGNSHPAHIHSGSAGSGGPIVLDFNPVDGGTGKSETMVTKLNDGTDVTYEDLIGFDGHVNVHLSVTEIATMIAQGNIGSNSPGTINSN